jgi:hypothetical protein
MREKRMMMIRTDRALNVAKRKQRRMFAITSGPITVCGKTIRRIVIFDGHPDSIRLLLDSDLIPQPRTEFSYAVFAVVLVVIAVLGMFWLLL